jgi:hypothetical protein
VTPPAEAPSLPPAAVPPPPAPAFQPPAYQPAYQPTSVADQVLSAFEQLETQEASPRAAATTERAPVPEPVVPVDPNPPVQVIGGDATVTPKRGGWWRRR